MAKLTSRKKRNQKMVYAVIFIAAGGLLLSSVLAYFGGAGVAPRNNAGDNYAAQIADLEYTIGQYETSLEQTPENFYLLSQLGNSYYQLGVVYNQMQRDEKAKESFAKAVVPYGKALEVNPDDVNVRVDRAVAAFWSDNYQVAEEEFKNAIEINPEHAKAHFNYGIFLYLGLSKPDEAIASWNRVVELNPADDAQLVATAQSWIAQVEEDMKNILEGGQLLPGGAGLDNAPVTETPETEPAETEE